MSHPNNTCSVCKKFLQRAWAPGLPLLLAMALGASCGPGNDPNALKVGPEPASAEVTREEQPLYIEESDIWDQREISVCWKNFDSKHPEVHAWVREAAERSWSFAINVRFVGWLGCSVSHGDVEITVGDNLHPSVTNGLDEFFFGTRMKLNFKHDAGYCGGQPRETYQSCMESIGIHEFGHVLGFAHEQNRDDTPATCSSPKQGANGSETFGVWDGDSIMNYCNENSRAYPRLSGTDIAGAQRYYGISPAYFAALGNAFF